MARGHFLVPVGILAAAFCTLLTGLQDTFASAAHPLPPRAVSRIRLFGVKKEVITPGDGKNFPKKGDTVTMHYTGTLSNGGKKFDSSLDRGQPFVTQIGVGRVIKGWDEGVPQMSLGEKAILKMTSDYGYGPRGAGGVIPPNADLTFEVELLQIN
eukprot:TRINITY_DN44376_c0_g1_i1.p1 TRINITY_DN44376_c0_g1~~TRINITY_DN44376_c0_g1_i1.p1  ORF type:complete len:155 (-),score=31.69 TRINITY_DN44376_c0_g1_i1:34-498(-)